MQKGGDKMFDRYKKLMFPIDSLIEDGLMRKKKSSSKRVYKTKAVRKRRAANKVAYKSRRINHLVDNHQNKR